MEETEIQAYLDGRFAEALKFYDDRAVMYKRWYRRLSVYVIFVSAILTPFVSLVPPETSWRIASAFLSGSIVVATSLLAYYKCHENWLSYRASWDALKREREFYGAGLHEYRTTERPNELFFERIEAILAKEGTDFYARHLKCDEQTKGAVKKGR